MARTLTQIYTESVAARNNYLQLTELQPSLLSTSKLSIMNLITYVVSVAIYTYETILDTFKLDILTQVSQRMSGTPDYYLRAAKLFQFDNTNQTGDELVLNENTLSVEYSTVSETNRIIEKVAYQLEDGKEYDMTLRVCKAGSNSGEYGAYEKLTDAELSAFKDYINKIKFVGTEINCVSVPGDILTVNVILYYNDKATTGDQAFASVKDALVKFLDEYNYNDYVYYQKIIDTLQSVECVTDIEANGIMTVKSSDGDTFTSQNLTSRLKPNSGYLTTIDEDGATTLTYEICSSLSAAQASTKNIKLIPNSAI